MKKIANIILLSAGILLSLTGCQKGSEINNDSDNLVRFIASTGVNTRTAYSGQYATQGSGESAVKYERIDWTAGDKIMVWSDNATVRTEGTPYFSGNTNLAVYTIGTPSAEGEKSIAPITDPTGSGLVYPKDNSGSTLWAAYPALAADKASLLDMENNAIQLKIEAEQAMTQHATTKAYSPDMQQAVMLGYVSGAKAGATVDLPFYPAFTDFEFNLVIPQDEEAAAGYTVTITEVEFTSTSSALSGGFTATCGTTGKWAYAVASDAAKTVKATFAGDGITLDKNNPNLTFNVFALPQDLTNLKVTFYTNEGTKTLKLIEKKTSSTAADSYLTFEGAKKHRLNGVILPTGWNFKYINLRLEVLEWDAVTGTGDTQALPQATQFSISGAQNGDTDLHIGGPITDDKRQKDPYRQQWFFQPGQKVRVTFKVMLPAGGSWEVVPVGGTTFLNNGKVEEKLIDGDEAYFTIKNVSPDIDEDAPTVTTNLWGNMKSAGSTNVELEITYNGTDTAEHCFFFKTYVYTGPNKTGTKFSIDSETQIYDRGRGFHTFIVNCTNPNGHPHSN